LAVVFFLFWSSNGAPAGLALAVTAGEIIIVVIGESSVLTMIDRWFDATLLDTILGSHLGFDYPWYYYFPIPFVCAALVVSIHIFLVP
jgi:hypothetical protein